MTCCMCGGRTEPRYVTAENWWGEELTLVTGTPAEVCQQCGEQHFSAEVTQALDAMHSVECTPKRVRRVPEYAYAGH